MRPRFIYLVSFSDYKKKEWLAEDSVKDGSGFEEEINGLDELLALKESRAARDVPARAPTSKAARGNYLNKRSMPD